MIALLLQMRMLFSGVLILTTLLGVTGPFDVEAASGRLIHTWVNRLASILLQRPKPFYVWQPAYGGGIRLVSIERGFDPKRFAFMPFGGGGALHAGAMLDEVGLPVRSSRAILG